MKKKLLLAVSILGIGYLLSSCSDDDKNTRTVTYILEVEEAYRDKVAVDVIFLSGYEGDDEVYVTAVVDGAWNRNVEIKYAKVLGLKAFAGGEIKATVIAKDGINLGDKAVEDILITATIKEGNKTKAMATAKGLVEVVEDDTLKR